MSRYFTDSNGITMYIPDSSVTVNVVTQPTGLAANGIIALVGEADQGPHWSQEAKLANNIFGPGDLQSVINKYGSGQLVDGFRGMIGASASPRIQGSFTAAILVKANLGTQASRTTADGSGTFTADLSGAPGNSIKETILTSIAEAAPTTGSFSYVPSNSASALYTRVNGGSLETLAVSANTTPAALATEITALAGLNAVGGIDRVITSGLSASNNVALAVVSGQSVTITIAAPAIFGSAPQVGDTVRIPSGSVIAGAGNANVGWYVVTGSVNTSALAQITATKVTSGAPLAVSSVAFSATPASDLVCYSSMTVNNMTGTNRGILTGLITQTAIITVAGSSMTFTLSGSNVFAAQPKVGDTVYIPTGSAFVGAGGANIGWYQITAASNFAGSAFITAARLSNGNPVAVSSTAIAATTDVEDIYQQIRGAGKSMEFYDGGGAVNVNTIFYQLGTTTAASWLQTITYSAAELQKQINLSQPNPLKTESFLQGGNIVMSLGYSGTTATCTISKISGVLYLKTTVTGGNGANLSVNLSTVNSIQDLVDYVNMQPGYTASSENGQSALMNPSVLDQVTSIGICSTLGNQPGEIKRDVYDMTLGLGSLSTTSVLVTWTPIALAGLPEDEGPAFLTNGARGASSGLNFSQAVDAMANIRCNFVVSLVSQDASKDAPIGITDSASTYTVDAINAAIKTHCLAMSTPKVKRHRIGFVSKNDTFANCILSAQTMSTYRIAHTFQPIKDTNGSAIVTFQPWMGGCKAASMQAGGFYKAIFNKAVNVSGIVDPVGFDDQNNTLSEQAVQSGLVTFQTQDDGSVTILSDQLTYGLDNNFVYNSIQAVYVADVIALSLASALKNAFVGESVADVTPSVAVSFIKGKMAEFLTSKLIVGSTAFPAGWKNINVSISQGVMVVRCVVIEATAIYFIPINVDIEGLTDSAAA